MALDYDTIMAGLEAAKVTLAANLTTMGAAASGDEALAALAAKVLDTASILTGDAAVGDVLAGKTFYNTAAGTKETGTKPDKGANNVEVIDLAGTLIPAGSYNGSGLAVLSAAEAAKVLAENIKKDVVILDVTGTYEGGAGGIDAYTKALLHFDGANNGTTFTDESGKTWTAGGDAKTITSVGGLGGSAVASFDGSGDYIYASDSDDFAFGSGDWTIDFWFKPNSVAIDRQSLLTQYQDANNYFQLSLQNTEIIFYCNDASNLVAWYSTTGLAIVAGVWQHFAIVRSGTTMYLFVNGVSKTFTENIGVGTTALPNLTASIYIGARKFSGVEDRYMSGYLEEFRVSKGIARWTSGFIPGSPYPS